MGPVPYPTLLGKNLKRCETPTVRRTTACAGLPKAHESQEGIWFQIVEGGRRGRKRPEGLTLWRERKSSRGKVLRLGGYGQLLLQDFR
jgi:hypothetical protein